MAAAKDEQEVVAEGSVNGDDGSSGSILATGRISKSGSKKRKAEAEKVFSLQPRKKIRKGSRVSEDDMVYMMNKILTRELMRVTDKKKRLKLKKAKRKRRNPTDKQKAQWAHFADTVKKAKKIYKAGEGRKPEDWSLAMKKAAGKLPEDAVSIYESLVEGMEVANGDEE